MKPLMAFAATAALKMTEMPGPALFGRPGVV
jgi:hypothetical protein